MGFTVQGHPFLSSKLANIQANPELNDPNKAARDLRAAASVICRYYTKRDFPKYRNCNVSDAGAFPKPLVMARSLDSFESLPNGMTSLLIDMIEQGNRVAHPEGGEKVDGRVVRNCIRDLPELLSQFSKDFPQEETAGKSTTQKAKPASKKTDGHNPPQNRSTNTSGGNALPKKEEPKASTTKVSKAFPEFESMSDEQLLSTNPDSYCGDVLDAYRKRLFKIMPDSLSNEYRIAFYKQMLSIDSKPLPYSKFKRYREALLRMEPEALPRSMLPLFIERHKECMARYNQIIARASQ